MNYTEAVDVGGCLSRSGLAITLCKLQAGQVIIASFTDDDTAPDDYLITTCPITFLMLTPGGELFQKALTGQVFINATNGKISFSFKFNL